MDEAVGTIVHDFYNHDGMQNLEDDAHNYFEQ